MIENLPKYISIVFLATTILTLLIFYWAIKSSEDESLRKNSTKILIGLISWIFLQGFLSINNIYSQNTNIVPPKIFLIGVLPTILSIIWLFTSNSGKRFIDNLQIKKLTFLNLVRIPVEFVLFWLFLNKAIPKILTFEGWNFDIVMGLTAPIIIYYGFVRKTLSKKIILFWNVVGILLLIFVFILALLSSPFPLQQLAFDQPNTGLLNFPFSWLPTFIVPIVILGHLISIRQLMKKENAI